jgi:hypothetical protein
MTIQRMDNVLIVVEDIDAVISFFVEIGMELEHKGPLEGRWAELVIGINDVRQDIAMLRTPDGHGRVELAMFHTPKAVSSEPNGAAAHGASMPCAGSGDRIGGVDRREKRMQADAVHTPGNIGTQGQPDRARLHELR